MKAWVKSFIRFMVIQGIIDFGSFKLKSGRTSPYYFNLRKISDGKSLSAVSAYYAKKIVEDIGIGKFDVIFGPSYAGIPLSVGITSELWTKHKTIKRYAFDRKEEKTHGDPKDSIIAGGHLRDGDRVLIVDDVITTGETKLESIRKLSSLGLRLDFVGVLVAFNRLELDENGVYAGDMLEREGLRFSWIVDAPSTFSYLLNRRINREIHVTESNLEAFNDYFHKYGSRQSPIEAIA